eukprot:TRINITY_DN1211_c6_g1_i1.p1 TRINITY_DN1211_c6_g1~~TRINITY_DN1211_c6_g1_i1.p1  ORF type:complete len:521 (+),score=117.97 TRINITY_DN1211_c6_g1_i1:65-1627(+)
MITPRFVLTQDHNFVIITMKLKHVKISELQFVVEGNRMTFHAKPYFLRLTFDQEIMDDESGKASFDVEREEMKVLVPKKNKGEVFTDLDCLTKLLSTETERKKMVQEIGDSDDEEEFDYETRQIFPNDACLDEYYGFNEEFTNFFSSTSTELPLTEVSVDSTPHMQRINKMRQDEGEQFIKDADHYLTDYMEPDEIKQLLSTRPVYYSTTASPPSWDALAQLGMEPQSRSVKGGVEVMDTDDDETSEESESTSSEEQEPVQQQQDGEPSQRAFTNPGDIGRTEFTTGGGLTGFISTSWSAEETNLDKDDGVREEMPPAPDAMSEEMASWEKEQLLRLPKKRYLVTKEEEVMAGLVDLLSAYCYDHITTEGEGNTESVWTYTKLSPSLSYVVKLPTLRHAVICFLRRAVTFPLHRHLNLAKRCVWDVAHLLSSGSKMQIVRCLLRMKWHIDHDDSKYPLSNLYLAPYATWVQSLSVETLQRYGASLVSILSAVKKSDLGLPLAEMEALAEIHGLDDPPQAE